jgi:hypothetical protein
MPHVQHAVLSFHAVDSSLSRQSGLCGVLPLATPSVMDESGSSDGDGSAHGGPVTSILGIKGPLRFRLHGSSQKAHVVLRRVPLADNFSDSGRTKKAAYFSLFAHKRIEVKPGKEILLSLASANEAFTDKPVIFEADLSSEEGRTEDEGYDLWEEPSPMVGHTIPPKMRRVWTKRCVKVRPIICKYGRCYAFHFTLCTKFDL